MTEIEMLEIAAGEFVMGGGAVAPRTVTIARPFYLGKYPVTQAQWKAVMGANHSKFRHPGRPVEGVSWDECQEFITRLNAQQDEYVYRLPSEAEWEYACRAGATTPFSFGETLTAAQANF
jgi:formylglycine-generating enzyme required for sulfatase activity